METSDVNHTALYKAVEKEHGFKSDTFARVYKTESYRGKDKKSREFDEVISMTLPFLGFKVAYSDLKLKSCSKRYALIYKRTVNTDPDLETTSKQLQDFYRHYRRHEGSVTVMTVDKITDVTLSQFAYYYRS